jgi:hypothetical protein
MRFVNRTALNLQNVIAFLSPSSHIPSAKLTRSSVALKSIALLCSGVWYHLFTLISFAAHTIGNNLTREVRVI